MSTPYQPTPYGSPAEGPPPSNLVWGILVLLLCGLVGLIAGIVSIVNATQVGSRWASGDHAGAQEASRKARQWAMWGAIISVILFVLGLLVLVATGTLASMTTSP